jgi:hypothetical protein
MLVVEASMSATILAFPRRQPAPTEVTGEAALAPDGLPQAPLTPFASVAPALTTPRQIAHRWAMLAHLKRIEGGVPRGTVR